MTTGLRSERFGKIELSDPRFEHDHLRFLTFNSPALQGRGDVTLYVPPDTEHLGDLPLVVLLHGVYNSHWAWAYKAGAHRTAQQLIETGRIPPLLIAMPSDGLWAEGSGYVRHSGRDYEAWIVRDVVGCVMECMPRVSRQSRIFIGGLSMGGYAALRLGAKYPQVFDGISAHSAFITMEAQRRLVTRELPFQPDDRDDGSVMYWMLRHRQHLPSIRLDCGVEDRYIEQNRTLHQALHGAGIRHDYEEYPGGHTWDYWAERLPATLLFFAKLLSAETGKQQRKASESP